MRARTQGLTIVEGLIALLITAVAVLSITPLFVTSMNTNAGARLRTQATGVAETWLDRYRARREPLSADSTACTGTGALVCTYGYHTNFAASPWPAHVADAEALNSQMQPFKSVITATPINTGPGFVLWQINAQVLWKEGQREKSIQLTTRILQ